jgi:hypothetical protein
VNPIIIIALCVLAGVGICLMVGFIFPASPFGGLSSMVAGYVGNFNLGSVLSNSATIPTAIASASAVAIPLISKVSAYKKQAEQLKMQATQQTNNYATEFNGVKTQLSTTASSLTDAQKTIDTLNTAKSVAETKASTLQAELNKVQGYYTELQKIKGSDLLGSLPGNTVITNPDGSQIVKVKELVAV